MILEYWELFFVLLGIVAPMLIAAALVVIASNAIREVIRDATEYRRLKLSGRRAAQARRERWERRGERENL